eukprot:SM002566S08756  [mRNA]  locus=s2566:263:1225:+ [translate_table: standard]
MAYSSRTWKLSNGEPMHAESGFWRPKSDGSLDMVVAQSTGIAEVQKGVINVGGKSISVESDLVGNASKVVRIARTLRWGEENVGPAVLEYEVSMEVVGIGELLPHLRARLVRVEGD